VGHDEVDLTKTVGHLGKRINGVVRVVRETVTEDRNLISFADLEERVDDLKIVEMEPVGERMQLQTLKAFAGNELLQLVRSTGQLGIDEGKRDEVIPTLH
jgi:hypothetical protein